MVGDPVWTVLLGSVAMTIYQPVIQSGKYLRGTSSFTQLECSCTDRSSPASRFRISHEKNVNSAVVMEVASQTVFY